LSEVEIRLVVDTLHEGCDAEPNLPRQLAERIGVQEQAIQRYEATGHFGASFARLVEIANALGISGEYVIHCDRS
jgi:transcriptional regulator with XRE-family HTH domain